MHLNIDEIQDAIDHASALKSMILKKYEDEQCGRASLFTAKGTRYQTVRDMKRQGDCISCMTAEGDFITSNLLNKKSDTALFLKSHTQEPYTDKSKLGDVELHHPSFPMINFVTPKVGIEVYFRDIEQGTEGITPRFVPYIHNSKRMPTGQVCNEKFLSEYYAAINKMLQTYYTQNGDDKQYEVAVEKKAVELLLAFQKDNLTTASTMPELAAPYMSKAHGQAARFAWDIHAVNHSGQSPHKYPITVQEMEQAINLVKATFPHVRYIYDHCGFVALNMAKEIVRSILRITGTDRHRVMEEGIDSTTLQQRIRAKFPGNKSSQINNALCLLERHNALSVYDSGTNNLKVVLHPHFFSIDWKDYGVMDY